MIGPVVGFIWAALAAGEGTNDAIVVCAPSFRAALQPWIDHRATQGVRCRLVAPADTADATRNRIRDEAPRGAKWVVLVGDTPVTSPEAERALGIPTFLLRAKVNRLFGSEPHLASDVPYGDFDGDQVPDAAVGRLSCRTPAALTTLVEKILAYERTPAGAWRQRINIVAGIGGFGPVVDSAIEWATAKLITGGIPSTYDTTLTLGNWQSPYCPDPRRFSAAVCDRLQDGCLFWVYIGHGQRTQLDHIRVPGGRYSMLNGDDVDHLQCSAGAPIALLLACHTGAFDSPVDCLGERMVASRGGPIAAICGSRVTMPYAMSILGSGLMDACFEQRKETLGEILLSAQRHLPRDDDKGPQRQIIDSLAAAVSPRPDLLAEERAEHVYLFNLLGDPTLRMPLPQTVALKVDREAIAGSTLVIEGTSNLAGSATIDLVLRRDRSPISPAKRTQFDHDDLAATPFDDTYRRSNDRRIVQKNVTLPAGPFRLELAIPADARGACHVRASITDEKRMAIGASDIFIRGK